jgi:hypothetical protein
VPLQWAMGMFDRVLLENDIPDPDLRDLEWQTKSLENMLLDYRVTREGELIVKRQEFGSREDPDSLTGMALKVVGEWEEKVEHHGVVETYSYEDEADGSARVVTYFLYFTYGKLTSLERTERTLPPRKVIPRREDDSPRVSEVLGDIEVDLPETIEILALRPEGALYLLKVRFDGYLLVQSGRAGGNIEIGGSRHSSADEPIIESSGWARHREGNELEVLAESRSGRDHLLVIVPKGYRLQGRRVSEEGSRNAE